jgi:hypothetical protein
MKYCKDCEHFYCGEHYSEQLQRYITVERCRRPFIDLVHGGKRAASLRLREERYELPAIEGRPELRLSPNPAGPCCGREGRYFKKAKPKSPKLKRNS